MVEQSHLPVRRTLEKLGIQPSRFYRWCDRLQAGGPEALEDKLPRPKRVWNRILDAIGERIVQLALDEPELSPRELATRFIDTAGYFVSEASVYRLLKAHDLIASPACIVMKAADEFKDKTTAPNQLWQTDFTYLKVTGWGWFYLSTVLGDLGWTHTCLAPIPSGGQKRRRSIAGPATCEPCSYCSATRRLRAPSDISALRSMTPFP